MTIFWIFEVAGGMLQRWIGRLIGDIGLGRYGSNLIWLFVEKGVRLVLSFFVGIYVARRLGPEQYGALNYAISFVVVFTSLSSLGLEQMLVRELVRFPRLRPLLQGTALGLRLIGISFSIAVIGAILLLSKWQADSVLILIIAVGYFFSAGQMLEFYFQAEVKSKYVVVSQIAALVICSVFRVYAAYRRLPLAVFAAIESAYIILSVFCYAVFYRRVCGDFRRWRFNGRLALRLLRDCWPIAITSAVGLVYMRVDQLMLKTMIGDEALGYYSVAIRVVELFYFIPMALSSTLFPAIVRAKGLGEGVYRQRFLGFLGIMTYVGLGAAVTAAAVGGLIPVLYGRAYAASYGIYMIYVWRIVLCTVGVASGCFFLSENLMKYPMLFGIMGMLCNIGLNWFLISAWGCAGAAVAALITLALVVWVFPLFFAASRPLAGMLCRSLNPVYIRRCLFQSVKNDEEC